MFYLAHFVFTSPDNNDRSFGYFTCIAEASGTEEAMAKFEDQIHKMSEESDLFDEIQTIFLEDIIEFESLPTNAILTRLEMFAGERPVSANITLPDQRNSDRVSFYRPISDEEDFSEGILVPFIEFED